MLKVLVAASLFLTFANAQLKFHHGRQIWPITISCGRLYSGARDWPFNIKIWNIETGDEIMTMTGHSSDILSLLADDDSCNVLYSGSVDTTFRKWNTDKGREVQVSTEHTGSIYSVSKTSNNVITGATDSLLIVWNCDESCSVARSINVGFQVFTTFTLGDSVFAGGQGVKQFNVETGVLVKSFPAIIDVWSLAYADGYFYAGCLDKKIRKVSMDTSDVVTFSGHTDRVRCVIVVGDKIVSGSDDRSLRIWNRDDPSVVTTLRNAHGSFIMSLLYRDSHLYSASLNGFVNQ